MKIIHKRSILAIVSVIASVTLYGQMTAINVNLNVKHIVDDISEFDREKYITIHSALRESDWTGEEDKFAYLVNDLDVYFGRDNGVMG